jgi:O-antigen/teichoic acid export membrane protein
VAKSTGDRDVDDLKRGGAANLAGTVARVLKPVSWAIIANLYGENIFGQFVLTYAFLDLLVGMSVFGTDHGMWNFISRYREVGQPEQEAQALRTGMLWTAGISILIATGILLFADPVSRYILDTPDLAGPLRIVAAGIPALAVARVLLAATRGLRFMRYHVLVLDFGETILICSLAPAFYFGGFLQEGVFWALVITELAVLVIASACFLRHFSLPKIWLNRTSGLISREMLSYDLALGWGLVAGLLTRRIDIFMIKHFQPISVVGAYAIASEFGGALGKIRASFSPVIVPVLAAKAARSFESMREPSAFMALSVTALSLPLLLIFLVAGPLLLSLFQPEFVSAYGALLVIAIANILHGLMGPPGEALSVAGAPRYVAIFASVQVVVIAVLGLVLIPWIGMLGAAIASGGAVVLSRLPLLVIAKRAIRFSSLSTPLFWLIGKGIATIGIGGAAAVMLREHWPLASYTVGLVALLVYAKWAWSTISTALKKKPSSNIQMQGV